MINQAIILSAGLGKRLRPLTNDCPKPMLMLGRQPVIAYHLESLAKSGVTNIVIHVSYLKDRVIDFIGNGSKWGVNVEYAASEHLLGTGGGIKLSQELIPNKDSPYFCVNADIFTDFNFENFIGLDDRIDGVHNYGHLILVNNPKENLTGDYNIVKCGSDTNKTDRDVIYRGDDKINNYDYTYSGIAVYHPKMFSKYVPDDFSVIDIINSNQSKFTASFYSGIWYDIGSISKYNYVNNKVLSREY